jgi:pimeloyl-ACP methyl ester carboxylesterase
VFVQVRGTRLFFDVMGPRLGMNGDGYRERPTVVLLHGGPGVDHTTLRSLDALSDLAQLVFVDQRGHGRSAPESLERLDLDTWIQDVFAFCEALGIDRPILFGQSFGGIVALGAACRRPGFCSKLIVASSLARFRRERSLAAFERIGAEVRRAAEAFFSQPNAENLAVYRRVCMPHYTRRPRDLFAHAITRMEIAEHFFAHEFMSFDFSADLRRIDCPTLVLGGTDDPITTREDAEDLAAAIPSSRLALIADAGHGVFRDQPEEALRLLCDFVAA